MGKKKKNDRIKLPKRLLGVKLPKEARRNVNDLLAMVPASTAKPLAAMAVTAVTTVLAERLEQPLKEWLQRTGLETEQARAREDWPGMSPAVRH
jgi:hypothetical protein